MAVFGSCKCTFACANDAVQGQMVKISGNGAVAACTEGEKFAGQIAAVGRDGAACSVVLGGMVTAVYTGSAPALGWNGLSANGTGGVQTDASGREHLVVDVDETGMMVTFVL